MNHENIEPQKCCPNDKMKLKILAIHGYRQNAETFRSKTGSFRKMIHKWAEFTYITAPHKVILVDDPNDLEKNGPDIGQSKDEEQYGWFFNRDDKTFRGIRKGGPAIGFEDSLKYIEDICEKEGPFDGLLGFSQGACFAGLLCDLQQRGLSKFTFNFAIFSSGFKSGSLPHLKYYIDRITIPSLHIFGENDQIIPTDMSEALSNCFEEPFIVRHPGGHYLPASAPQKSDYQKFIKLQLLKKQCNNLTFNAV
ncbi:esterase AGAP003155 [Diabrotica virgifera virgifera]|uniref:Esterase AGAP003155 n=1 Tax=Diabrotica virgifera virgifera TaxID=50390 RepID=A0A6P7G8T8_DIAVI|nr:esterase AGAP003155 [Diabrotica virgifera virgifera]